MKAGPSKNRRGRCGEAYLLGHDGVVPLLWRVMEPAASEHCNTFLFGGNEQKQLRHLWAIPTTSLEGDVLQLGRHLLQRIDKVLE